MKFLALAILSIAAFCSGSDEHNKCPTCIFHNTRKTIEVSHTSTPLKHHEDWTHKCSHNSKTKTCECKCERQRPSVKEWFSKSNLLCQLNGSWEECKSVPEDQIKNIMSIKNENTYLQFGDGKPRDAPGPLPHNLETLVNVRRINCASCGITGEIPESLTKMPHLQYFQFSEEDGMTGGFPDGMERLCHKLTGFEIRQNINMGGEAFPESMRNCKHLTQFYINGQGNSWTGKIPSWVNQMTGIWRFVVQHTNNNGKTGVYGELPANFGKSWNNLEILYIDGNNLEGELPVVGNMENIRYFQISGNKFFSQTIPNEYGLMSSIVSMTIQNGPNKQLASTATIPDSFMKTYGHAWSGSSWFGIHTSDVDEWRWKVKEKLIKEYFEENQKSKECPKAMKKTVCKDRDELLSGGQTDTEEECAAFCTDNALCVSYEWNTNGNGACNLSRSCVETLTYDIHSDKDWNMGFCHNPKMQESCTDAEVEEDLSCFLIPRIR